MENLTKSLLIIDDDIGIRDGLAVLMGKYFNVDTASSGKEALGKIENNRFDVYLIDLYLGDISGFDILKKIKSDDKNSIAIILTAYGDETDVDRAEKLGADEFLYKPITYNKLTEIISRLLEKGESSTNIEKYQASISKFISGISKELKVHLNIIDGAARYLLENYEEEVKSVAETIDLAVYEINRKIDFLTILSKLKNKSYKDTRYEITINDLLSKASSKVYEKNILKRVVFENERLYFFKESLLNIFTILLTLLRQSKKSILHINKKDGELFMEIINLDFSVRSFLEHDEEFSYPSIEVNLLRELLNFVKGKINIKSEGDYTNLIITINLQ